MSNLESLSHSVAIYALSEVEERIASFSWSLTFGGSGGIDLAEGYCQDPQFHD